MISEAWRIDALSAALLEHYDQAAAILDGDGRVVAANEEFASLAGRSKAGCRDRALGEIFPGTGQDAWLPSPPSKSRLTRARTAAGVAVEIDCRALSDRGGALALVRAGHAGPAVDGPPPDVTGLPEVLPGTVRRRVLHPDGRTSVAASAVGPGERTGMVPEGLHPDDVDRVRRALQTSATSRVPFSLDFRVVDSQGQCRWYRSFGAPCGAGEGAGFACIDVDITDLKDHEARFYDITRSGSDWIFETDESLRYTYLSEHFSEITGIPVEQIIGRKREEIYGADLDDPVWQAHLADLAARRPYRDRVFHLGAGAERRWFRTSGVPVFVEGTFKGYRGVATEITDQMQVQERLRESEERFRDVVESSSDWIWEMDADLRFTFLSDRFQQVTGITQSKVLGLSRKELGGPFNDAGIWPAHEADLAARRPFREFRYAYRDGSGRPCYQKVSGRPIFNADGTFTGYRGTGTDITAQVEAELALKDSEQRFRHFTEAASDWIWEMDADLRFTFISERLRELTGTDPSYLIGRTRGEVASSASDPGSMQEHLADLEARRPFKQFRYTFRARDGRDFHMMISGSPIFDADRSFRGYRGTATDTSAQVEAERAVARHQALLGQAVGALAHGFALFDEHDRLLICNEKYFKLLGFDELPAGTPFADIVKEAIRLGLRSEKITDLAALETDFLERHRRADGVPEEFSLANGHWIRSSKTLLSNGCKVTIQVDITEMKLREQALRDSEARFRELADAAFEGILVHDGRAIVDVNRAFIELTGMIRSDVTGRRSLGDFFDPAEEILTREEGGIFETVLHLGDGRRIPVEAQCKAVPYKGRSLRVVAMRDISERRRAEAHIRHLAHHDGLTGLPNRLRFRERLQAALVAHERNGTRLALLQLDLDNFKDVNDTLGHHAGDVLLCEVARRLRECVRQSDTVARLGGDEFAILLTGLARGADAAGMAQRIVSRMRDPLDYQGHRIHPGTSVGITVFPDDDREPEQLLKNADIALYRAKSNGRNGYSFFVSSMKAAVEHRRALESELRRALQRDEFRLLYQPQIDLESGRIVGIEALLRWAHPERGLLAPSAFLPVAEESGLIVPIGQSVIRTAAGQARRWLALGFDFGRLAVNVAAHQFKMGNLARKVRDILIDTGLPPERLEIEITEGVFLGRGNEGVAEALRRLARMRIRIALDDFGTGYASLAHLKSLPIDRLKIDQSFVRDIGIDPDDAAIVRTVLSLGHALGLEVVAEGVETPEQQRFLSQHGCRTAQGYLFSRPLEPGDMTAFLQGAGSGRPSGTPTETLAAEPA